MPRALRRPLPLALAALLALAATGAMHPLAADEPKGDPILAEGLFKDAKRLMKDGKFAEACPKLAESQRIDPKLGTLLNLAACHAAEGKTASAWTEYSEAAAQAARAGRTENEELARKQIDALEPRLSRLVITSAHAVADLVVTLDGTRLGAGVLGSPLPVDPGTHAVGAMAPGRTPWSSSVEVATGPSTATLVVPELATATSATSAQPPTVTLSDAAPPSDEARSPSRLTPMVATLGAVAVVGAGVGTYFGLRAFSKNSAADAECKNGLCTGPGLELDRQAHGAATVSTIAFGVGAAAAVGAVVVFFSAGTTPVRVGLSPTTVSVSGAF